jgi:hypothetical protein
MFGRPRSGTERVPGTHRGLCAAVAALRSLRYVHLLAPALIHLRCAPVNAAPQARPSMQPAIRPYVRVSISCASVWATSQICTGSVFTSLAGSSCLPLRSSSCRVYTTQHAIAKLRLTRGRRERTSGTRMKALLLGIALAGTGLHPAVDTLEGL